VEIPKSLQEKWIEVSKDKSISVSDYGKLVTAAAPNGSDRELDDSEIKFLRNLKSQLETHDIGRTGQVALAEISFVDEKNCTWKGYTKETVEDFRNAFKGSVDKGQIPVLDPLKATKIAEAFDEKSVKGLQHKVNAQEDGKFGPETYVKSLNYLNEELKSGKNNPQTAKMSEALNLKD
jgi:hypothetical protein